MNAAPVTLDFSKAQPIQAQPQGGVALDFSKAQPIQQPQKEESGFLDKEIPLSGPWYNPTLSGVQSIGRGVRSAARGAYNAIAHPVDTATATIDAVADLPGQIKEIPGAIRDINASPDPLGTYAKVAQDTAGEGAGQALLGAATEGARIGAGKIARPILENVTPVQVAKGVGGTVGAVEGHGPLSIPGAYYGAKGAGRIAEGILGKERANSPILAKEPPSYISDTPRPEPLWKTNPSEGTEVPSILNRQPLANPGRVIARPVATEAAQPLPAGAAGSMVESVEAAPASPAPVAKPSAPLPSAPLDEKNIPNFSPEIRRVPSTNELRGIRPGTKADVLEDKAIQEQTRDWHEEQGRRADSEALRGAIARSSTGVTKGDLIERARSAAPKAAPRIADPMETIHQNAEDFAGMMRERLAQPDEDLTPILQKSLDQAKQSRQIGRGGPRGIQTKFGAGAGSDSEGQAVSGPRAPSAPVARGAETQIRVPGEDRSYRATYAVRELADVQPSHSGDTFNPNEKYALTNDRDYSNKLNQGKIVTNAAPGKFDPVYHITDNPDATNGPVVIDSDGHALGGNGRAMILQRVYKSNPEGATAYKNLLTQKAQQFGLDPKQISGMKQPVLVREIADADLGPTGKQNAITDFNKVGTASMTPAERAIADSRRVSPATLDDIAGRIAAQGENATLADAMRGANGAKILDRLIDDGAITPQERAAFADQNGLTQAGRERISKLVVGRFFRDPIQVDSTPVSIRSKLEAVAAPVARVEGLPGWDLTPKIQEAVDLLEEARMHGTQNLDDVISQGGLWSDSKYSPEAVTLAKHLQSTPGRALAKSLQRYAADAGDSERPLLLGEKVTPKQAFSEALEIP